MQNVPERDGGNSITRDSSHKACHDSSDWVGYTESWVSDAWEVVDEESAARSARSNSADSHKAAYVEFGSASDRMDG